MSDKNHYLRMFRYDHWANLEFLHALQESDPATAKILRLITHVLAAEKLWLERLRRIPQSLAVWPASTIEQALALEDEMASAWIAYLNELPAQGFDSVIEYRNSKGEEWSSTVRDILTHVVLHSAYHRGQAALEMRSVGKVPVYTDFIHGIRKGLF